MKKTILIISILIAFVVGLALGDFIIKQFKSLGSVATGQDYYATSTPFLESNKSGLIKNGAGSLGTVVITTTGNTKFSLLDATSTAATKPENRTGAKISTSTIEIASFNTAAVGTYVLDAEFYDGLYFYVLEGTTGSTTITFR